MEVIYISSCLCSLTTLSLPSSHTKYSHTSSQYGSNTAAQQSGVWMEFQKNSMPASDSCTRMILSDFPWNSMYIALDWAPEKGRVIAGCIATYCLMGRLCMQGSIHVVTDHGIQEIFGLNRIKSDLKTSQNHKISRGILPQTPYTICTSVIFIVL